MRSDKINFFSKLAIIVVICFCLINIVNLQVQYNALRDEAENLQELNNKYREDIDQINSELNRDFDDEYIMRIAREKLNYFLPDEIIFYNDK